MVKFGIPSQGRDPLAYTDQRLSAVPTVESPIDPTVNDRNYPIQTLWRNKTTFKEWILVGFTGGDAQWVPFADGAGSVLDLQTDDGNLVQPNAGVIDVDGTTVANAANAKPVFTDGATANTMEVQVQLGTVVAPTPANVNSAGLVCVNTNQFTVDATSGMVSLKGGTVNPPVLSFTMDDTNQVFADSIGDVDVVCNTVGNTTHAKPLFSKKGSAADDFEIDVQVSAAIAATDINRAGICSFDNTTFAVDGSAFVTLVTTAVAQTITGDSGGALSPTASNWNILGGTGASTAGSASTLTINTVGGGITWTVVTGATQAAAINNGYICNRAAGVTVTLPDTAAVGSIVRIAGMDGNWILAQNAGETVYFGLLATTTGAGGSLTATDNRDCVELVCSVADTDWIVLNSVGNLTVT